MDDVVPPIKMAQRGNFPPSHAPESLGRRRFWIPFAPLLRSYATKISRIFNLILTTEHSRKNTLKFPKKSNEEIRGLWNVRWPFCFSLDSPTDNTMLSFSFLWFYKGAIVRRSYASKGHRVGPSARMRVLCVRLDNQVVVVHSQEFFLIEGRPLLF